MTSISTVQSAVNAPETESAASTNVLGQEDFLQLLTTQLSTQDPFEPMENGDFIAQMAQFSTVSSMGELTDSFNQLAESLSGNQVIQAASLIDHAVLVDTAGGGYFDGELLAGQVNLEYNTSSLNLKIYTEAGELVDEIGLGAQNAGDVTFSWDGTDMYGQQREAGRYRVQATALVAGEQVEMSTEMAAMVQSVLLNSSGGSTTLTLQGIGEVSIDSVQEIL